MSDAAQKTAAVEQHSRQAEEFEARYAAFDPYSTCFHYSRKRLDAWIDRFVPADGRGLRLLDVGCGTGHHMASLRERGFEVVGVDGSAEMLEKARLHNPGAELHHSDVDRLPVAEGRFDYVLCVEVLRYLPDPRACLAEMARVLKPGGTCVATATPYLNLNLYWPVNRLAGNLPVKRLVRLRQFFTSSGGLRRQLAAAGFAEAEVHGVYLGPINWVERLAPFLTRPLLKAWEPLDVALADLGPLRDFSNMLVVRARR